MAPGFGPGQPTGTHPAAGARDNPGTMDDPTRCPLCGGPNGCAMEAQRATGQPQPPCRCTQVDFSAELLARVPEAARDKACICVRCHGAVTMAPCASSSG